MGLFNTTSIELGRYRALQKVFPPINNLRDKSILYLCFDGKELGMSSRYWQNKSVTVHSRSEHYFKENKSEFAGRVNISKIVKGQLDEEVFDGKDFDVIIWWNGPASKDEFSFMKSLSAYANDFVIVGYKTSEYEDSDFGNMGHSSFHGMSLAFGDTFGVKSVPHETKKAVKPTAPKPKKVDTPKAKSVKNNSPLSEQEVVVGELKIDVTALPTNIDSTSTKVQETSKPKKPKAKPAAKRKSATKKPASRSVKKKKPNEDGGLDIDSRISKMSDKEKIDVAFMITGDIADTADEAEAIIRSKPVEEVMVVI